MEQEPAQAASASTAAPEEASSAAEAGVAGDPGQLVLMTLNLQYFSTYPTDRPEDQDRKQKATEKLLQDTGGHNPPDLICVQEGLAGKNVLDAVGFELQVCAGSGLKRIGGTVTRTDPVAQTVHEMVYGDAPTLERCPNEYHKELLCNQIYLRRSSSWQVQDAGIMQISSDLQLVGVGSRAQGRLAVRSMVWVKLRRQDGLAPNVYVMCTHITGGRFEDQYFVQQLAEERRHQPDRILRFFEQSRPDPQEDDVGVLLGDYNATFNYKPDGPMSGYFKAAIASSPGVQADAEAAGIPLDKLEEHFEAYMLSPFNAIRKHNWSFAYDDTVGVTSSFGHLIDHMAMNVPLEVVGKPQIVIMTNQKFTKRKDTDLELTDHNSVKTVFRISGPSTARPSSPSRTASVAAAVLSGTAVVAGVLQVAQSMSTPGPAS